MRTGGQIPWNAIPICEKLQISYLMGKPRMRDALGNHSKDQLFHLVHWWNIFQTPRGENSSIWKESLTWIVPRIRIVRGGNSEG